LSERISTPKKFALASGIESRNLRTVAEFADQILVVIRELASRQSRNQDGLPEKIPFGQTEQLYIRLTLFDKLRSIDSSSNCSDQDCAVSDAVKKHGLIDLSDQYFSTGDFGDAQIEDVVVDSFGTFSAARIGQ
jgi:hypothetical protein